MCLHIKNIMHLQLKPIILDKPMIVYKYGDIYSEGKYFFPYYHYTYYYERYILTNHKH